MVLAACAVYGDLPPPPDQFDPQKILEWSKPDHQYDLIVRIEQVVPRTNHDSGTIFLRLQNTGETPLLVPTGIMPNLDWVNRFELYLWDGDAWHAEHWKAHSQEWYHGTLPEVVELDSSQSTLIELKGRIPEALTAASHLAITLQFPVHRLEDERMIWSGSITTPPYPAVLNKTQREQLPRGIPLPTTPVLRPRGNLELLLSNRSSGGGGLYSNVLDHYILQDDALTLLDRYDRQAVLTYLAHGWQDQTAELDWRLFLASVAARYESQEAIQWLLTQRENLDYRTVLNVIDAIGLSIDEDDQPAWAVQGMIDILEDERQVGIPGFNGGGGIFGRDGEKEQPVQIPEKQVYHSYQRVCDLAFETMSHVVYNLGRQHCTTAVPVLIKHVKDEGPDSRAVSMLGDMGDPRAIPVLLEVLGSVTNNDRQGFAGLGPASALAQLKAEEVAPMLLEHIESKSAREALGNLGDLRAINALQPYAEDGDMQAKIALVKLGHDDPMDALAPLLNNPDIHWTDQADVLRYFRFHPDARIVPVLLDGIHHNPHGKVLNMSIELLAFYPGRESIEGLLRCFDANFEGKRDWKYAYEPIMFQRRIAESLQTLTGEGYGPHPHVWRRWWNDIGRHDPRFE